MINRLYVGKLASCIYPNKCKELMDTWESGVGGMEWLQGLVLICHDICQDQHLILDSAFKGTGYLGHKNL